MKEIDLKKLFDLALDQVVSLEEGLYAFSKKLREDYDLKQFFDDPTADKKRKKKMFHQLMPEASLLFSDLIELIIAEGMEKSIPQISEKFTEMVIRKLNMNFVDVSTPHPLTEKERKAIEKMVGGKVLLRVKQDPSLIAGIRFRTSDGRYFDCTLKGALDKLKEEIVHA